MNRIRGEGGRFHSGSLDRINMKTVEIEQNQQYPFICSTNSKGITHII